ncbi:MAG: hypothetical protein CVU07_12825 [Bacteroidetes bacterium HGW-Bacteroidetes-23]|nr:MAG: hypothetical protein CVU07_12825 [Bacteroidetes bacterium HGW-Bacteroidetes-23]
MSKIMNSKFKIKIMGNQATTKKSKSSLVLIVMISLLLPFLGFSQDFKIIEVNEYLKRESMSESRSIAKTISVKSLIKDLHPSIYVNNGSVNTYGKPAKVLFVDAKSISKVRDLNLDMSQVELVTIKINKKEELSTPIDLSIFSNYPTIKVIYLTVSFDCTVDILNNLIKTDKTEYTILYSVEKPS